MIELKLLEKSWSHMISIQERKNNMYFRGGSKETTFEFGQQLIDDWSCKIEEEVLMDRVQHGLKPLAQIVVQDNNSTENLVAMAHQHLVAHPFVNAWGVPCVSVVRDPDVPLRSLFNGRQLQLSTVESNIEILGKRLLRYYVSGCDLSLGHTPFECCAAFGNNFRDAMALYAYH